MESLKTDVLVVGSGLAGMLAALEARQSGIDVTLLCKGPVGGNTCTATAAGIISSPSGEFSVDMHRDATLEAGRGINDPSLVDAMVERAEEQIEALRSLGVPIDPAPTGFQASAGDSGRLIPGVALVESVRRLLKQRGVATLPRFSATEILVKDGMAAGVKGIVGGVTPRRIGARAVVLATGGAAGLYQRNDNPPGIVGEGYSIALRAGCSLRDMEFVQFYPIGFAEPSLPNYLAYPPYPEQAKLVDADGRDVLWELEGCKSINDAITRFRDTASLLFQRKHLAGGLYLDMTGADESYWARTNYATRLFSKRSFDFRNQRCRVAPIAHFSIGGVVVGVDGATRIPGLFAAGEVAGGLHGANRLGGNSLTDCIVLGTAAGEAAAIYARHAPPPTFDAHPGGVFPKAPSSQRVSTHDYATMWNRVQWIASEYAGVIRSGTGMEKGLEKIGDMEETLSEAVPGSSAEWLLKHRAVSALLVLKCILGAGLVRTESRGAFFRDDFPEQDDRDWCTTIHSTLDDANGLTHRVV